MPLQAITSTGNNPVELRRISLNRNLQQQINQHYGNARRSFFHNSTAIEFTGDYKADHDEHFFIPSFALDNNMLQSLLNPINQTAYNIAATDTNLKGLIHSEINTGDQENCFLFQVCDARKILGRGTFNIGLSNNTYTRVTNLSLSIPTNVHAVWHNGTLYFKNYNLCKRIIDLQNYYRTANATEVALFTANAKLHLDNAAEFTNALSDRDKTMIKSILDSKVLDKTPTELQEAANELAINIHMNNNRIHLPSEPREYRKILNFLNQNFLLSPLTDDTYYTNSKLQV